MSSHTYQCRKNLQKDSYTAQAANCTTNLKAPQPDKFYTVGYKLQLASSQIYPWKTPPRPPVTMKEILHTIHTDYIAYLNASDDSFPAERTSTPRPSCSPVTNLTSCTSHTAAGAVVQRYYMILSMPRSSLQSHTAAETCMPTLSNNRTDPFRRLTKICKRMKLHIPSHKLPIFDNFNQLRKRHFWTSHLQLLHFLQRNF